MHLEHPNRTNKRRLNTIYLTYNTRTLTYRERYDSCGLLASTPTHNEAHLNSQKLSPSSQADTPSSQAGSPLSFTFLLTFSTMDLTYVTSDLTLRALTR